MLHFLLGLAGVELRLTARRAATTTLLFALGGTMLVFAIIGLLAAIFIALSLAYDPIVAALLVAAGAFLIGTILLVVAYARLRAPARRPGAMGLPLAGLTVPPPGPAAAGPPQPPLKASTVLGIAAGAALIGLILGRRL
ncbi:phage holin family protein [Bosea sp. 117]|uniref:phage holin family protein n=1 Tax=Bosea sp. 117 TaxID=1125973 RepID=UPI0004947F43|nr:phage holin family protein [Bosea sp. 117]